MSRKLRFLKILKKEIIAISFEYLSVLRALTHEEKEIRMRRISKQSKNNQSHLASFEKVDRGLHRVEKTKMRNENEATRV